MSNKYQAVIGMEVHCELKTASKMFCGCANGYGLEAEPNLHICPVCMAHPGALPTANIEAIKSVIKVGLALNGQIAKISKFDRKNYFYPDIPKGYQISQYDQPITENGTLAVNGKPLRITRVHLEEDTGKLTHPKGQNYTLVDFNRAGVPLMELVTEPDITSAEEAKLFCQELQLVLRYIGISDADMEKGQMRCEANISILPADKERVPENFGTKVEVKNLNSFKAVERAIAYELERQELLIESGDKVIQETRGWDDAKQQTYSQRAKESAHDYRYFPEPDLPPLILSDDIPLPNGAIAINVAEIAATMPELPQAKRLRFQNEYLLSEKDATIITSDTTLADYTEQVFNSLRAWLPTLDSAEGSEDEIWEAGKKKVSKLINGWLTSELFKLMNEHKTKLADIKISSSQFADFLKLVYLNTVNSSAAQLILKEMFATGDDADTVLEDKDLKQIDDSSSLEDAIVKIIDANPGPVADYKGGKEVALQYLIGQGMKETKGKANPEKLKEMFKAKLG